MAPPRYDPRFFFVFSCLKDLPRVGFRSLLARSPQDPRAFFCTYNNIALYRAGRMPRVGGGLIVGMYCMCVLLLFVRGEKIALQTVSILTGYGLQIKSNMVLLCMVVGTRDYKFIMHEDSQIATPATLLSYISMYSISLHLSSPALLCSSSAKT